MSFAIDRKYRKHGFGKAILSNLEIIIKPYYKKITKIGVVKDVLTKAKKHTRGHKVRLEDGTIGRVVSK